MPEKKKLNNLSLGRSLIKSKSHQSHFSSRHSVEVEDKNCAPLNLRSVTEQSKLDEFISIAELAQAEFISEHENVKIISNNSKLGLLSQQEQTRLKNFHENNQEFIKIPRRPKWTTFMSTQELTQKECDNFLSWRRDLAKFQEENNVILTPFEKNIEFWRQLWRVIERSDVCVQILDARNPLLFLSKDLQKYVKEVNPNKMNLILLNKADFLSEEQRAAWANYFQNNNIRAVFFSALDQTNQKNFNQTQSNKDSITQDSENEDDNKKGKDEEKSEKNKNKIDSTFSTTKQINAISNCEVNTSNILSREELIEYFKHAYKNEKKENDQYVTIGLIGYPNVGKSSTINALVQCKKVSVSATPGKTKHFQTIFIDKELCLCDCPGLVFPNFVLSKEEMIINGILSIDQMINHVAPVNLIAEIIPKHVFETTYSLVLPETNCKLTSEQLLNAYGYMRGFMTQRGLPDNSRAARYLLKDFVNGKLLYCVAPPGHNQKEFHTWSDKKRLRPLHIPQKQEKLLETEYQREQKFDKSYFQKVNINSHVKGFQLLDGFTKRVDVIQKLEQNQNDLVSQNKPWKKHFNRNKKQKLRKKFSHLDIK